MIFRKELIVLMFGVFCVFQETKLPKNGLQELYFDFCVMSNW